MTTSDAASTSSVRSCTMGTVRLKPDPTDDPVKPDPTDDSVKPDPTDINGAKRASGRLGAAATTNCTSGTLDAMSGSEAAMPGTMRCSSFGRLPGSNATV